MARVTVEDCLAHVENRFALVLKAAARAHLIEMGAVDPAVPANNDKPTVIALREIAAGIDVTVRDKDESTHDYESVKKASSIEQLIGTRSALSDLKGDA